MKLWKLLMNIIYGLLKMQLKHCKQNIKDERLVQLAILVLLVFMILKIIQEKGTNRSQFVRGMVDKYTWRDVGSSYLLSELNAAYLSVQFDYADEIYQNRMNTWNRYYQNLSNLMTDEFIELPFIPSDI